MTETYTVTVRITVTEDTDDHLRGAQAIQDEVTSWLESLKADVEGVTVEEGEKR
jgi:hypothetical protein